MSWTLVAYAFGVTLLIAIAFFLTWEPRFEHFHRSTSAFRGGPFRLLSYNIFAFNLNPIEDLFSYLDAHIDELECIVLQEVWFPKTRRRLDDYFREKQWDVVRQNGFFSSGLYTACRHAMELDDVVTFPWAIGTDAMVRKGAMGVTISGGHAPKVVNLHLQDSWWDRGAIRRKQLKAMESVFGQALFVGDFNVNARKDAALVPASMGTLHAPDRTTHVGMDAIFDFCVAPTRREQVRCDTDPTIKYSDHFPIFVTLE